MSPYPTVVIVTTHHHIALGILKNGVDLPSSRMITFSVQHIAEYFVGVIALNALPEGVNITGSSGRVELNIMHERYVWSNSQHPAITESKHSSKQSSLEDCGRNCCLTSPLQVSVELIIQSSQTPTYE